MRCLHNADCHFWEVSPPVLLVEKHVACLPLMDVCLLTSLFMLSSCNNIWWVYGTFSPNFHHTRGFSSLSCHVYNARPTLWNGRAILLKQVLQSHTDNLLPQIISSRCVFMLPGNQDKITELLVLWLFKVALHFCLFETAEAVLGMNLLQGLLKLKVAACWQNVMYYRRIVDKPDVWFTSMAPVISMEMSWGVVVLVSPPQHRPPAMLMTVSMLIWGSVRQKAHLARAVALSYHSTHPAPFFTASPHTWHAAHMKRAQPPLTLPPSLTFTLFLDFRFPHLQLLLSPHQLP